MNLKQTYSVLRKEWWHIVRDRRTAIMVTLSPVFFLFVLAYSFSVSIDNVAIGVIDQDKTPLSQEYLSMLTSSGDLAICCTTSDYDDIEHWLTNERIKAAVVIQPGFMDRVQNGETAHVQIIIDGTDPNTANFAIKHLAFRTENFSVDQLGLEGDLMPIQVRTRTWYNPDLEYSVGIIPALIGVVLGMPAMAASLAVAREKEWGTLEGLIATPLGRAELVVGKLIPYVISGMISVVLCAAVAVFWFNVPFRGNFLLYLLLSAIFMLASLSIGLLISILVKSQQVAMMLSMLVLLFPGFFLSGIFIPLSTMGVMKMEAYLIPTTHYVLITRGIFVKGVGLDILWPFTLSLLASGLMLLGLSMALFRKYMDE